MSWMNDPTDRHGALVLPSVEDYLGDAQTRFFGAGYRAVDHRFTDVHSADGDGGPLMIASAAVEYPRDWSRKGSTDQRPHLSTIDVLVLGVRLAELWMARNVGLSDDALRSSWIRDVQMRAGRAAVEDELEAVPVVLWRSEVARSPSGSGRSVSTLECTVSTLTLRLELDHPTAPSALAVPVADPISGVNGRVVGAAYRARAPQVTDVRIPADRLTADAHVRLEPWDGLSAPGHGFEAVFQPSIGLIDAFVVVLQLGQILLYELDGLTRTESHTLWMRSTRWQASTPATPGDEAHRATVELREAQLLRNRENEMWRRADIVATLGRIAITCSVAHQLPTHAAPSAAL
ncbi:AvrD family protein [Kibdelosporangium phytohabitans]|uniref:Avirulence D protein (AvrD) n=1 Tax=Kibdelosporangium phytohabitans TaxID=860235 RepID=A0A0N9HSY9_9PSEU|nr:AvrD family protein [Kibdelosporangium phytohabitans]ALG06315.1 hypothetical protein AOZ06_04695 [Kibdelosporangium phytohabitans]MBE1467438.1 hypothetical protein [Kibdelosporangium phytohabitans]